MCKLRRLIRGKRRGSTSVLALMVSLMLMVLITATMALTLVNAQLVQDYARNQKTVQAADSAVVHGEVSLAHALSSWSLPATTTSTQVDAYATDAESGQRENDRDISLLGDSAPYIDSVLPRDSDTTAVQLENDQGGLIVGYGAAVDVYPTSVDRPAQGDISHRTTFHYGYTVTGRGDANIGAEANEATREEQGTFGVEVSRPSFSTYGYFTESMKNQFNQQLVFFEGEVYGGPTHVNSAPPSGRAGFYGQAVFNGPFSAVQARYEDSWLGGNANPQFNAGATWGAAKIDLPANGWSQLRASVGDYSQVENPTSPSNAELRQLLGLPSGTTPIDDGVYYSQNYNAGPTLNGGVLIKGTAQSIVLSSSGGDQLVTITMNPSSGHFAGAQTWVFHDNADSGSVSVTRNGSPAGNFNGNLNGLIHTEGNVTALQGNSSLSAPDIQADHQITVSATGNITITNHITYEDNPADNPDAQNMLGIFSSGGNVYLGRYAPNNLALQATVMAAGASHGVGAEGLVVGGGYDSNYPNKGYWNLLGGLIENKDQTTGVYYSNGRLTGYLWNFTYDERFAHGMAPPYFPYVTKFIAELRELRAEKWGRKYY